MNVLVGCEESQAVCRAFRAEGHEAFSCDIKPASGGHPEWHLQMDVFEAIKLKSWDLGIFFPDCAYLTCSAEWAYKEPPHHQKTKPGTLTGAARREARDSAAAFFMSLYNSAIPKVAIENPIGVMSRRFRKPDQVIQPYEFGHPESKGTCLWLKNLPKLIPTGLAEFAQYRCGCGNVFGAEYGEYGCCLYPAKPLWENQTPSGQNKLPPSANRAELRSKTYSGIAKQMSKQWV